MYTDLVKFEFMKTITKTIGGGLVPKTYVTH